MSPSSPSRHRSTGRKLALAAAALAVTVLPTACDNASGGQSSYGSPTTVPTFGTVPNGHAGHGAHPAEPVVVPVGNTVELTPDPEAPSATDVPTATADATEPPDTPAPAPPAANGLQILGDDCRDSALEPHDGFQFAPRCVSTRRSARSPPRTGARRC